MKNPGIYILTSPSGKQYVGLDSNMPRRANMHLRSYGGCRLIHRAIKKYGAENFSVEYIRYPGISREALNEVEKWKIAQLDTLAPNGYNLRDGGDSGSFSDESRAKMSAIHQEKVERGEHPSQRPEVRVKISATLREQAKIGEHSSQRPEVQAKMSETHQEKVERGEHNMQRPEPRAKLSAIQREKAERGEHSSQRPEVRAKTSEVLREQAKIGEHSSQRPEVQAKMSATHREMVERGEHHTQRPEARAKMSAIQREKAERGEHHFQSPEFILRRSYSKRMTLKAKRREMYRVYAVLLTSKSVMEEYNQRRIRRIEIEHIGDPVQLTMF